VDPWGAVGALASLGAAGAAAAGAFVSRASAREANAAARQSVSAAAALTAIERDRRRSEMTPRFRVTCQPAHHGTDRLTLRVMLLGPPGLHRLESLTVAIRDDFFQRAETPPDPGGPTPEQVKEHIWGPYRFTPDTHRYGPHAGPGPHARTDKTGRVTACGPLPVGEVLTFALELNRPEEWAPPAWRRHPGTAIRLLLDARIDDNWWWTLPCEIDTADGPAAIRVPDE